MEIIRMLSDPSAWQRFFEHKCAGGHLSRQQEEDLREFIDSQQYLQPVQRIQAGSNFAPPKKASISKLHSDKKRIVYIYPREENYTLKFLTFLLQEKYDHLFAPNLYSFRPGTGVRHAINAITKHPGSRGMWCYKVDISNYFNSVPVENLLPVLASVLKEDMDIYHFLATLLTDDRVEDQGVIRQEKKGIMAGSPISTFLANLYLSDLDWEFHCKRILYARYSDDIILFASTESEREAYINTVQKALSSAGLSVNPSKELTAAPGEQWVFLGVSYLNGVIDVAPASVDKLKAKMRRKARALMRWKVKKQATGENAAKAFIRVFRRKLFSNDCEHELTWTRWYFPLITTADSLRVIDQYSQSCIRYLVTGTHTKAAYNCRYEDMKALGYVSLVHCYYNHIHHPEISQKTVD